MSTALQQVANRLAVSENEVKNIVMNTIMPSKGVTEAQFTSFIAVANEYRLNPLTKEIYAFPTKGGGIQPIVSIDGWLRIINTHPDFNGMTFQDERDVDGNLLSITCNIYKKNTEHPVQVTEYMSECKGNSEPWNRWPARMLRHKAAIQAGRYAFGLSGIIDPDEAERFKEVGVIDGHQCEIVDESPTYLTIEKFNELFPKWERLILSGNKTASDVFAGAQKMKIVLSPEQMEAINSIGEDAA